MTRLRVENLSHSERERLPISDVHSESLNIWGAAEMDPYRKQRTRLLSTVSAHYPPAEAQVVRRAFDLATVAHQHNEGPEKLRYRKVLAPDGSRVPYMVHVMAGAELLAGAVRRDPLDSGAVLHIKQEPYNAEIVAGFLLHDVVEDTRYRGIEKSAWYPAIDGYLEDAGCESPRARNRITCMVRAVTKYETDELEELKPAIVESPLYHMMRSKLTVPVDYEPRVEQEVVRAIADTWKVFTTVADDRLLETEEDQFRAFFGALLIKFHDNEDNLHTPGTKPSGILRREAFAVLSRIMGFPVASRLAVRLASYTSLGDPDTVLQSSPHEQKTIHRYCELTARDEVPSVQLNSMDVDPQAVRVQLPIVTLQEKRGAADGSLSYALQYRIRMDAQQLNRLPLECVVCLDGKEYTAQQIKAEIHKVMRAGGRAVQYYEVLGHTPHETVAILKLVDDQPWPQDMLGRDTRSLDPSKVPEWNVIKNSLFPGLSAFLDTWGKIDRLAS